MKPGFDLMSLLPIVLIFVVMYFLIIRPQGKKAKQHQSMLAALKKGDKIVTNGGLIGVISKVSDSEVEVLVASGVHVNVIRAMIANVLSVSNPIEEKKEASKAQLSKLGFKKKK